MDFNFDYLKKLCTDYKLISLKNQIAAIENLLVKNKNINIAILGQFKAGKSSFINSFVGSKILPVGVIPVTSAVTILKYGETETSTVIFENNERLEINKEELENYISETKNPKNIKKVDIVEITLPFLVKYKGICFIDTPGIGSIFTHNTRATMDFSAETGIAFVTISAERPLSENEILLIKEIKQYCPEVIILLTKTDLFSEKEMKEIIDFMHDSLKRETGIDFKIFKYSVYENTGYLKNKLEKEILEPIVSDYDEHIEKIISHKTISLSESILKYLEIAYQSSLKSEEERSVLKENLIDEKINIDFMRKELLLVEENMKGETREIIFNHLIEFKKEIIFRLENDFKKEYSEWKGNLYQISRKYEDWIEKKLINEIRELVSHEKDKFKEILTNAEKYFSFYLKSFRDRLNENLNRVLGVKLNEEEWVIGIPEIETPDISTYSSFDFHLDLLFFLFPMFIYKNIFGKYFLKQIPDEVEKNIYRVTSDLNEMINNEIERIRDLSLQYIEEELSSLDSMITDIKGESEIYFKHINKLKEKFDFINSGGKNENY